MPIPTENNKPDSDVTPKLSVVVPVYNEVAHLFRVLDAVLHSDEDDYEVIVVDDGSVDGSAEVARNFPCRVIAHTETRGAAAARNTGAAQAKGDILFFLDADVVIETSTLREIRKTFREKPDIAALFCSYQVDTEPQNFFSVYKNLVHHYTHQTASTNAVTFCGGFGAVKRHTFFEVGGFDPTYKALEDIEFGYRLHQRGHAIFLNKEIQLTHRKRYSFVGLLSSDVINRAIPWTKIMLHKRIYRNDLNTKANNILSVAVAFLMVISLLLMLNYPQSGLLFLGLLGGLIALNWSFFRFVLDVRGRTFALKTIGMTWLTYLYSGLGLILGIASYLQERFLPPKIGLEATSP